MNPDTFHSPRTESPFSIPNVKLFIRFHIFFNCRFYYPVFTIMFLDFGLTLEDFAILNAIWAAAIVLLEVPSGALADVVGRRNLLVAAGALMIVEISLLCFVPLGNHTVLFAVFAVNRILSGAAEAAASGADEAIAFDSLKRSGNSGDWGRVLEKQMRLKSIFSVGAMSLGAFVYDPDYMQKIIGFAGSEISLSQNITLRFPLLLTLAMAILTFTTALKIREPVSEDRECIDMKRCGATMSDAFRLTFRAGIWIWRTPAAFLIILAGMVFDNVVRMAVTLNSQYFRLIHLPEASFGLVAAALSLLGLFIPKLSLKLAETRPPKFNAGLLAVIVFVALFGMTFFWPYIGLAPIVLLFCAIMMTAFFVSHYLNHVTESAQRATVLSFKGLCLNLSYGVIGILYSVLIAATKNRFAVSRPDLVGETLGNAAFIAAMDWFPYYFLATFVLLAFVARNGSKSFVFPKTA